MAAGGSCYRLALRLYPHVFYSQYAAELEADFDDASEEQLVAEGRAGLLAAWLSAFRDLPLSLIREWLRTPWPPVLIIAGTVATGLIGFSVIRATGGLSRYRAQVAANVPPPADSPQLLMLLLLMVLIPTASIILVAGVVTLATRHVRRPGRRV